eukprot:TRINITY_DN122724_c0_g1_i1.p1 TRINITY_DN122724_c0_g1~~TRINITY_DN122724_c0_g1_i1.p1  ORF type:complete len:296 (-),score=58.26 TRINITY_DN122724_c0_g1_i1:215-1102(-)
MPNSWWSSAGTCNESILDGHGQHVTKSRSASRKMQAFAGEQHVAREKDTQVMHSFDTHRPTAGYARAHSWSAQQRSTDAELHGDLRDSAIGEFHMEHAAARKNAKSQRRNSKGSAKKGGSGIKALLAAARNPSKMLKWYSMTAKPQRPDEGGGMANAAFDDSTPIYAAEGSFSPVDLVKLEGGGAVKHFEVLHTPEKPTFVKASKEVQSEEPPVASKVQEAKEVKEDVRRPSRTSVAKSAVPMYAIDDTTRVPKDLCRELLKAAEKARDIGQHILIEAEQSPDQRAHLVLYHGSA